MMTADQNLSLMMINNETEEESGDDRKYPDTSGLRIIFLAVLMLLSVTGNSIAFYVLTFRRHSLGKKRSRTMFLHITLADILVTIFPMTGQMVWEIMDQWVAGLPFCKIFKFLQTFSLTSSNYMILALSVERHRAVTKPLSVTGSPYRFILTAWLLSLFPSVPNLFTFTTKTSPNLTEECVSDFSGWNTTVKKGYFSLVFLVIFVIPLIIMLILYSHILYRLRETSQRIKSARKRELEQQDDAGSNKVTRTSIRVNLPQGSGRTYMSRAKEKTTNLALTVITVFVITNLPFMVLEFLRQGIISNYWCPKSWCAIFEAFIGVSIVSNSCLNPYIFLFFNSDNRKATTITTNCCLKGTSEERNPVLSVSFRKHRANEADENGIEIHENAEY